MLSNYQKNMCNEIMETIHKNTYFLIVIFFKTFAIITVLYTLVYVHELITYTLRYKMVHVVRIFK